VLRKNDVEVNGALIPEISEELPKSYKQFPNHGVLGIKFKLGFFLAGSRGKDNGFKRFLRDKIGEPPVLVDSVYIEQTAKSMKNYLRSKGHYYSDVSYTVKVNRRKRATVLYTVVPGNYYRIGRYELNIADREIYELVKAKREDELIKVGHRLDEEKLLQEEQRIVDLLRNRGYFTFSKEYLDFDVDTALNTWYVHIGLNIRNRSDYELHRKYYIRDITIEIDKNTDGFTLSKDTFVYPGFRYIPNGYRLDAEVMDRNLFLRKGHIFRQVNLTRSYGRLSDLNIFSYINLVPRQIDTTEPAQLDYYIKLSPTIKYDITIEPQGITSDQNNTLRTQGRNYGIASTVQFNNRNVFRNAETLQMSARGSLEAQGGVKSQGFFNAGELSFTTAIIVPRLLFFPTSDLNIKFNSTKTQISASAIYEQNIDYERRAITSNITYQINKRLISYYFAPLEVSYINTLLKSPELVKRSETDIFLQTLFSNNLIVDGRFGFIYTDKPVTKGLNFVYLKWDAIEFAGNALTFGNQIFNQERSSNGRFKLFGVNYFQYVKSAIDFRYNTIYDRNNASVFRIYTGVMVPYGNSPDYTPFEKRFFVGGANSLRAWRPRSVGPGTYIVNNQIDHSGDMKIEANGEFRFNLFNHWLEGAVFVDAGNIWYVKANKERPGAHFDLTQFYKQLAINTGWGIRMNFTFVILRFDLGTPLHDPTVRDPEERWVVKNVSGKWYWETLYFNFGIGYPF
jgi:outer membrane protein assembly factor BamA